MRGKLVGTLLPASSRCSFRAYCSWPVKESSSYGTKRWEQEEQGVWGSGLSETTYEPMFGGLKSVVLPLPGVTDWLCAKTDVCPSGEPSSACGLFKVAEGVCIAWA